MNKISRSSSSRSDLFARFANHRLTSSGRGMETFGPSRCLSTQLRRARGCSQLVQKGGHGSSHLPQREEGAMRLPRSIAAVHQRASQDQQIVCTGNHPRPAFGALRGTQPWDVPEQFLLVEAIAMLMRVAQAIRRADLGQRSGLITMPHEPTDCCRSRALPLAP